jgi:hypothetical protein
MIKLHLPTLVLVCDLAGGSILAHGKPLAEGAFAGRIAYSADGNHNDPDDWAASPLALAIFAEAGVTDRLVHFDYNSILPLTNPNWETRHAECVLGAAERYGFDKSVFFDCQKNLDQAIASIARTINDSSAEDPLYFIIAGPMEVPFRGIQMSDPEKRKFAYCISHSRWNDGFASNYKFTFTKRNVIEQDVHWVQIRDQNPLLSLSSYGRPARPEEFAGFFWMRDSRDPRVRFLWERMVISTRPDPSDAGMAYFLVTGDEDCDPAKLEQLVGEHRPPAPIRAREQIRIEAENFRHLEGCVVDDRKDKTASHQLSVKLDGTGAGRMRMSFNEPFVRNVGRYDVTIRYFDDAASRCRLAVFVNGIAAGSVSGAAPPHPQWTNQTISNVEINPGDELRVDADGGACRLDYLLLTAADKQ